MALVIDGSLHEIDGRFVLRFERHLAHPPERVWRAVVEPEENRHWYPARAEYDLRPGGSARFVWEGENETTHGVVQEVEAPRVLAFDEDGHVVRIELAPAADGGTALVFTHAFAGRDHAHRQAAGWQQTLDALEQRLAGDPSAAAPTSALDELVEAYRKAFA